MTPESVDELFTVAWRARPAVGALAKIVQPFVADLATARGLCEAWLPAPLEPGGPIPLTLPTGESLPASRNPWGRESSPLPGVDLPAEAVLDLAYGTIEIEARGMQRTVRAACIERLAEALQSLVAGAKLTKQRATSLIEAWYASGHPLRCLRAEPWPIANGHFDDERHAQLIACLVTPELADEGWRRALTMLIRSGLAPADAFEILAAWCPASGVGPTEEWIPSHLLPRASTMPLCPGGVYLSEADAQQVREACESGELRKVTGLLGLRMPSSSVKRYLEGLTLALQREGRRTSSVAQRPRGVLDDAIEALLVTRPLHWTLLAKAQIVEDATISTMAVGLTRRGVLFLFYSPAFVASITQEELQGVLCHEIYHVMFGHLDPPARETEHDRTAWILACEASVNEYVPFPLPGEPITIQSLGLPPDEGTYDRYHRLQQATFEIRVPMDMIIGALNDTPTHHGDLASELPVSANPLLRSAAQELRGIVDEPTKKAIRRHPGKWVERLTPERLGSLHWDALLRLRGGALLRRYSTLKFPSRRFPALVGIVSGRRSKREKPTVLAAIDTSASMSTAELHEISTELFVLVRMRLRVACIQCDTEIRDSRWLTQGEQVTRAHGRGGTDLRPPFSKEVLHKFKPELIVYFTDGYGEAPASAPRGVDVLWVLTGDKPKVPAAWGTSVCLRPRQQRHMVTVPGSWAGAGG